MGGAWLNGAESRIALERRRGAEGHREGAGGGPSTVEERGRTEREKESLPGRNKLARNERQIASELSARSPDVIEAAMPLPPTASAPSPSPRLRVSLLLPSVRLAHFLLHLPSPSGWTSLSLSPRSLLLLLLSLFVFFLLFLPVSLFLSRSSPSFAVYPVPPGVRKETERGRIARQLSVLFFHVLLALVRYTRVSRASRLSLLRPPFLLSAPANR